MTSMPGRAAPDGDEDQPPRDGPSQPEEGRGVELGMSDDGAGGTFEPEEDPVEDVEN